MEKNVKNIYIFLYIYKNIYIDTCIIESLFYRAEINTFVIIIVEVYYS